MSVDLTTSIGPLKLANPVITASGTFGSGREYGQFVELSGLGAIVPKTVTLHPRPGNRPPRLWETPAGMLNAIGLQNDGIKAFLKKELPFLREAGVPVIVNVAGERAGEYAELCAMLDDVPGVSAIELNISCPNVEKGVVFSTDAVLAAEVTAAAKSATAKPLFVKLSPNVTDIVAIAGAVREAGADAVSLTNTLLGMAIDTETGRPRLANVTGGLSGPAIMPVALRMVYQVAKAVEVPIIGMGGIASGNDAVQFILAGASAVAVGTAGFVDPRACEKVRDGIAEYMERNGVSRLSELIGALQA